MERNRDKRTRAYKRFQYNYCFGGTLRGLGYSYKNISFQYNYCFGGTQSAYVHGKELCVSIQLLFRWNLLMQDLASFFGEVSIQLLFRWNLLENLVEKALDEFQYNYCFGGTIVPRDLYRIRTLFQYNYCFGGTYCSRSYNFKEKVSIQLLFRWNLIKLRIMLICAFVSIQLLFRWNSHR